MKSVRNTTDKTEIQELIANAFVAQSHTEIQSSTKSLCDRVTVYRVLERLTIDGLIHKVVNVDGVVKYAGCHSCSKKHNHNHIHFSCQKCKSVTCIEDVEQTFKMPKKCTVSEMNYTISGLCPKCSQCLLRFGKIKCAAQRWFVFRHETL